MPIYQYWVSLKRKWQKKLICGCGWPTGTIILFHSQALQVFVFQVQISIETFVTYFSTKQLQPETLFSCLKTSLFISSFSETCRKIICWRKLTFKNRIKDKVHSVFFVTHNWRLNNYYSSRIIEVKCWTMHAVRFMVKLLQKKAKN